MLYYTKEMFLTPECLVVNLKTKEECESFLCNCPVKSNCNINGVTKEAIAHFKNLLNRIGFEAFHFNAGIQTIPFGDLCIEYHWDEVFTVGSAKQYKEYGYKIASLQDFIQNNYLGVFK